MPFMVVSDDDYEKELRALEKVNITESHPEVTLEISETNQVGRGNTPAVPESLREVIAEEKLNGASSKALQEIFKVSPASISAYANGATSTASYNRPVDKLTAVRNRVSSRAANRLNEALKALATKDLTKETARDISAVAKDMAVVFDKISPVKQQERDDDRTLHLHLYAPPQRSISDYETIDVTEKTQ